MKINKNILNPWYITGMTDSEGSFSYYVQRISPLKDKITVSLEYKVAQKSHSENVLYEIKSYFSDGSVVIDNRKTDTKKFHITNLEVILEKIIPHFEAYPCLTSKNLNFKDWKAICKLISQKKNLTRQGSEEILALMANMNTKRLFKDKYNYCNSTLNLNEKGIVQYSLPPH